MSISIHQGSILDVDADVLVSPSNSFLHSTVGTNGGLAGVIEREALKDPSNPFRPGLFEEECRKLPLIPVGDAAMTGPGRLVQFAAIIHAVGPIWGGGDFYERQLLRSVYDRSLLLAELRGYTSIVFPAISAGIFGCPIEVVARAAVSMCSLTKLNVIFALMDEIHVKAFKKVIALGRGIPPV